MSEGLVLFFLATAIAFVIPAVEQPRWNVRRWVYGVLALICLIVIPLWSLLQTPFPALTAHIAELPKTPSAWFTILMVLFIVSLSPFERVFFKKKGIPPVPQISTPELRRDLEELIGSLSNRLNARLTALEQTEGHHALMARHVAATDSETRQMAGKITYLVERALRERFPFPLTWETTEGMYFNDILGSTHLIWTEEEPKKLRRQFAEAMNALGQAYKRPQSLQGPHQEKQDLENAGNALVSVLKG